MQQKNTEPATITYHIQGTDYPAVPQSFSFHKKGLKLFEKFRQSSNDNLDYKNYEVEFLRMLKEVVRKLEVTKENAMMLADNSEYWDKLNTLLGEELLSDYLYRFTQLQKIHEDALYLFLVENIDNVKELLHTMVDIPPDDCKIDFEVTGSDYIELIFTLKIMLNDFLAIYGTLIPTQSKTKLEEIPTDDVPDLPEDDMQYIPDTNIDSSELKNEMSELETKMKDFESPDDIFPDADNK